MEKHRDKSDTPSNPTLLLQSNTRDPQSREILEGFSHRAACGNCDEDETMNHTLTDCTHPTTQSIWNLAKKTWPHDESSWPEITLGAIIGCGLLQIKTHKEDGPYNNKRNVATEDPSIRGRISDMANEQSVVMTRRETKAPWQKTLNRRISEDTTTASRVRRTPDYIKLITNPLRNSTVVFQTTGYIVGILFKEEPLQIEPHTAPPGVFKAFYP